MGRKKDSAEVKPEVKPAAKKEEEEEEKPEDPPIVKALKELDDKYLAIEREYEKEVQQIRKKYQEQQQPLLDERATTLSKAEDNKETGTGTPALKGFWLQALQNHPAFDQHIEQWDEPVLEYLKDITAVDLADDPVKGFTLKFHFVENPFFSNEVLTKEYHTEEGSPYTGETNTKKIVVSEIKWKPGKDVTVEKVAKKVKGGGAKKAKQKAAKATEEPRDSIFRHFFRNMEEGMTIPEDVNLEFDEDEVDDEDEVINMMMENDYEIGEAIKDQIIPFAVRWYTGEAAPEDEDDDEDGEEEDDEDDDDDDDEDDEDSDEDEEPMPKKKGGKKPAPKAKGKGDDGKPKEGEGNKEECKQQ
jgi:nucleosome assembly protein 1-like 1